MFTVEFDPGTLEQIQNLYNAVTSVDVQSVINQWATAVRPLIVSAIRETLGHSALYTLNPDYQALKERNPFLFHPNQPTDPGQPLILTGAMWSSIDAEVHNDTINVYINDAGVRSNAAYFMFSKGATFNPDREHTGRKRKTANMVSGERISEYAVKWELETHFIEIGIMSVEDVLVELLSAYVAHTYGYNQFEISGYTASMANTIIKYNPLLPNITFGPSKLKGYSDWSSMDQGMLEGGSGYSAHVGWWDAPDTGELFGE